MNDLAIRYVKALSTWVQTSLELNGTPDGWVPISALGLSNLDIEIGMEWGIIRIKYAQKMVSFDETNVLTIYARLTD